MNQPFEAVNDLERALVAALQNQVPVTTFMQTLLAARVFILVDREPPPGSGWNTGAAPMVLSNTEKTPFLAVFTAPERTHAWTQRQTAFGVAIAADFARLLKDMKPKLGIAINPGQQAGFEMQSTTLAQLRVQAR